MADLTIVASTVAIGGATTQTQYIQFGETVTQGQPIYLSTDNKWYKADANVSALVAGSAGLGVALTPGTASSYGYAVVGGPIIIGATVALATTYIVSATAGGVAPIADLASSSYNSIIGTAISTTVIQVAPNVSGVIKP